MSEPTKEAVERNMDGVLNFFETFDARIAKETSPCMGRRPTGSLSLQSIIGDDLMGETIKLFSVGCAQQSADTFDSLCKHCALRKTPSECAKYRANSCLRILWETR